MTRGNWPSIAALSRLPGTSIKCTRRNFDPPSAVRKLTVIGGTSTSCSATIGPAATTLSSLLARPRNHQAAPPLAPITTSTAIAIRINLRLRFGAGVSASAEAFAASSPSV